mgnify:FL=1
MDGQRCFLGALTEETRALIQFVTFPTHAKILTTINRMHQYKTYGAKKAGGAVVAKKEAQEDWTHLINILCSSLCGDLLSLINLGDKCTPAVVNSDKLYVT